jgi:serine/threonine protein kinase
MHLSEKLADYQTKYGKLVPTLHKFGVHNGQGWLVLNEVCDEITTLTEADVEHLGRIPKALRLAGVIDRDIRPANIMRCRRTTLPMKIDFGFAVQCDSKQTEPLPVCGTVKYASRQLLEKLQEYFRLPWTTAAGFTYRYTFADVNESMAMSTCYFANRALFKELMPGSEELSREAIDDLIAARERIKLHAQVNRDRTLSAGLAICTHQL